MTVPWLANCPHTDDCWCLSCTQELGEELWEAIAKIHQLEKKTSNCKLYYESHITIDPVFGQVRESVSVIAKLFQFRLADLIMKKQSIDPEQQSQDDTFMTSRGQELNDIVERTQTLIKHLKDAGCVVRRFKIEDTIMDSNLEPELLAALIGK